MYNYGHIISPRDEIETLTWNTNTTTDEQLLELVKKGITGKGKKKMVVFRMVRALALLRVRQPPKIIFLFMTSSIVAI